MTLFFIFVFLIPIVDQITKFWIKNNICELCVLDTKIPFLKITHLKNSGAALGMFDGGKYFFVCVSIIVMAVLLYFIFIKKVQNKVFILASSFIIGGGMGNLIDRIFFGYVTDYLKISFFSPVCNLSDYFISIGIIIIIMAFYIFKNNKNS